MRPFDSCKANWLKSISILREKAGYLGDLALTQRVAGDTAGAKVTAEQALNTLEPLYKDKPDDPLLIRQLAFDHAYMGEKDLALKASGACSHA